MTFTSILVLLLMLSILVAAHELGHYLFARMFGMDVEEFSIGFGRPKWCYFRNKAGTEFTIRPIPLGGFVRVKGMVPEEDGSEVEIPNGFYSKSPMARFWVLAAGPAFSILFGVLLLVGVYTSVGIDKPNLEPVIGMVNPGGEAQKAGLKPGDRITRLDAKPVGSFYEVLVYVRDRAGQPIRIEFERGGKTQSLMVTPKLDEKETPVITSELELGVERKRQGKIGARWEVKKQPLSFGEAIKESFTAPLKMASNLLASFSRPANFTEDLGGPGTIAVYTSAAVQEGLETVIILSAVLSMSLGFMNLLPIPILDGGQMVVAVVEMLRRGRRLSYSVQNAVSLLGMALMVAMIVGVIILDVNRFNR
ncbi:MAG: Metalloprotease MmpA [Fimbriimonadaceae bacterium]|nr:Metalloprotease MmpA [Fimbriimonadaceae bacterium]